MVKRDFSYYKSRVLIHQAAEMAGYSDINDNDAYLVMQRNSDKIVIIRSNDIAANHYFNPQYDTDKGDLITFIANRLSIFRSFVQWQTNCSRQRKFDGTGVLAVLNWLDGIYQNKETIREKREGQEEQPIPMSVALSGYDVKSPDATAIRFLKNRCCLSEETIQRFSPFIYMCRKLSDTKYKAYNIAFPYTIPGIEGVCYFESRNYGYRGYTEGKAESNALWIADFSRSHILTKEVFIVESAVNAMSYAELHTMDIDFSSVAFVALGNQMCEEQILGLQKYFPCARLHLCFSNTLEGHIFDIRMACILEKRKLAMTETTHTICCNLDGREFELPKSGLNYSQFKKASKCVRVSLYIHKPRSLVDVLTKEKKKATLTFKDYNECLTFIKLRSKKKPSYL